jgi:polyisoprenoid-binding protein YceI
MTSSKKFRVCHVKWILAGVFIASLAPVGDAETWRGAAKIAFQGTSTLHDFSGTAQADPFPFLVALDGKSATLGGTALVAVARMDTQHAKRDENMRTMFEATRFPLITGVLAPVQINPAAATQVPLELTIRGRSLTVPATLTGWRMEDNVLHFELDMTLSLQQFGLSPPVLLGFIKVGDAVPVQVRATLEKAAD